MTRFKTSAIILAGGSGTRMGSDVAKQYLEIFGKTVIERTLFAFDKSEYTDEIIVVVRDGGENTIEAKAIRNIKKPIKIAIGGKSRAESAINGLQFVDETSDFVAIHDAARCLITPQMIDEVIAIAHEKGCATAVTSVSDTVKIVGPDGNITSTVPREIVYRAQTPQVFRKDIYVKAIGSFCGDLSEITDDNMLVEKIGHGIYAVDIGPTNIKITTPDDLVTARHILIERGEGRVNGFRIGHGYDVHKLVEGRALIIGGVNIQHEKGLLGHSDADVLVHAIMDSLLGAAGLGDIGKHFPDTDEKYRGASSIHLLTLVADMIKERGFTVSNVDATLVLQKPKVAPYIDKMVSNVAFALSLPSDRVNIKATTEEHLGFTGKEEGAAAHAVSILESN